MSRAPKVHPQPVVSQRRATVALGDRAGLHSTAIETLGALNHPSLNHDHSEHMVSMLGIILPGIQACSPYIARRKACEDQRSGQPFVSTGRTSQCSAPAAASFKTVMSDEHRVWLLPSTSKFSRHPAHTCLARISLQLPPLGRRGRPRKARQRAQPRLCRAPRRARQVHAARPKHCPHAALHGLVRLQCGAVHRICPLILTPHS